MVWAASELQVRVREIPGLPALKELFEVLALVPFHRSSEEFQVAGDRCDVLAVLPCFPNLEVADHVAQGRDLKRRYYQRTEFGARPKFVGAAEMKRNRNSRSSRKSG